MYSPSSLEFILKLVLKHIPDFSNGLINGAFIVFDKNQYRIKMLPVEV